MKRNLVTTLSFALASLVFLVSPHFSESSGAVGQKRSRRPAARPATRQARIDYSRFSHSTQKHQQTCNTCHKVPSRNWRQVRDYPDIADYPDHAACVSCHRSQFFKGAKPVICSVCHSKVSPRDDARFAFRNPAGRRQFMVAFPHDKHQDVIAQLIREPPAEDRPSFLRTRFVASKVFADDKTKRYNNCELCHGPLTTPAARASGRVDGFVPDNLTFKSEPVSHASCFSCHWKSERPVNSECAGCHKLELTPGRLTDINFSKRISMKFRHGREQHIAECTTCHINITRSSLRNGLRPDVPITSCTDCHNKVGQREDLNKELQAIDKARDFVCAYCHTSDVGRLDPPASHYLTAERPPLKRKDIK